MGVHIFVGWSSLVKIIFVFGKMDVEVKCPDCDKMVQFRKVKEHVSSTHYSSLAFLCKQCAQSFDTAVTFRTHFREAHNEKKMNPEEVVELKCIQTEDEEVDLSSLGFYSPPASPDSDFSEDSALSHEEDLGPSLCDTCGDTTRPGAPHTCPKVELTNPAPLMPARPVGTIDTAKYLRKLREQLEQGSKDEAKTWNARIIENQGPSA